MNTEYRTDNSDFAAYLLVQNFQLKDVDKTNPKRIFFVFDNPKNVIADLYLDFINANLIVEITAFISAKKKLKGMIFQEETTRYV